eukprot:g5575.t1
MPLGISLPRTTSLALLLAGAVLLLTGCAGTPRDQSRTGEGVVSVLRVSDVAWGPLNPARGDASPRAGDLWGDRASPGATGFLVRFADGFASPPHIHNVTYRGVVIQGRVHNDDPGAAEMWMPPGSYWTQPAGESHVTSSMGESMAYIEIGDGPYLVRPTDQAFDTGERPINVDRTNLVWLNASAAGWIEVHAKRRGSGGARIATLWATDAPTRARGALLELPGGFRGTVGAPGSTLRSVVIEGRVELDAPGGATPTSLDPGSAIESKGGAPVRISTAATGASLLYARPGHVLVRIAASSVNTVDTMIRTMGKDLPLSPDTPAILGMDFAGTVEAVGEGVEGFAPGDEVYGCAGGLADLPGTLAESIAADARLIAHKPRNLSMREAAALPLVGITAYEGLQRAGIGAGQKVLVHGGSGGVGHVAIQLARHFGAEVYSTGGGASQLALIERLGATPINYKTETVEQYVAAHTGGAGFDLVYDSVGGANLAKSFEAAALNGQIATTVSLCELDLSVAHFKGLSLHVVFMLIPMLHNVGREEHGEILRKLSEIVEGGALTPVLDEQRFTLDEAGRAHARLESGRGMGKVVVDVDPGARNNGRGECRPVVGLRRLRLTPPPDGCGRERTGRKDPPMRTTAAKTRAVMLACGSGLAMAWPAMAAPPASLDQAPGDVPIVVSIRDMGALIDKLDATAGVIGLEGQARMAPQMANMMLSMPGIDRNGSMTLLVYPPEDGQGDPDVLVIAPVSDYNEFASVMGGDADAAVTTLNMQGNEVRARNLGNGFALLSDDETLVSGFDAGAGRLAAHTARLGVNGGRVADVADITIIADIPMLGPMIRAGMDMGREQAADQAQLVGGADGMLALTERAQEAFLRDARVGVMGLSVTEIGLALDFGVQFKDGSESAGYFAHEGTSEQLLSRLPAVDYYAAWAFDSSSPKLRELGEMVNEATAELGGGDGEQAVGMSHLLDNSTGLSGVIGANPGLMMTGIMANTVIYARTENANGLMDEFQQTLEAANGSTIGGTSYNTEFTPASKTIGGVPVSAYAVNMDVALPADNSGGGFGPDPQMISQAMFGAAGKGPRGYVAATEHGLVHTFSRSETFMSQALESAGGGAGLTSNAMMQRVSPLLPEGRTFEGYLALDQVGQTVAPFMLMMGMADQVPNFDAMPPIAMGVTTDAGGMRARLIMPNEVIKTIYGLAPLAGQMGGMGGMIVK